MFGQVDWVVYSYVCEVYSGMGWSQRLKLVVGFRLGVRCQGLVFFRYFEEFKN